MGEFAFVTILILVLAGSTLLTLLSPITLLITGFWVSGSGFVLGVPAGVLYHWLLYKKLHPRGVLPKNWIWHPIPCNKLLEPHEKKWVLRWYYGGITGGFIIVAGQILMGVGLWIGL